MSFWLQKGSKYIVYDLGDVRAYVYLVCACVCVGGHKIVVKYQENRIL